MTAHFTAIVEGGRLRPTVPLGLAEGTPVEVIIVSMEKKPPQNQSPAEILAAIAALPSEPVDPMSSARHDEVLYCREAHP